MRLTTLDVKRIRKLRYNDGRTQTEVAKIIGCSQFTVHRYAPGYVGKVPNDKVRAAFIASGKSASEVARHLGWYSGRSVDSSRVLRTLGLRADTNGQGRRSARSLIDAEVAALMAEAIGVMPWEVMPDDDEVAA